MHGKLKFALLSVIALCFVVTAAAAKTKIRLELAAEGPVHPMLLVSPPDGTKRRFIVEQRGTILILMPDGKLLPKPFLDIGHKMVQLRKDFDERGLLSMAFHPKYRNNGKFYVYYSAPMRNNTGLRTMLYWNHTAHIAEYKVSKEDANVANEASERLVMQVDQPQFNHNGGNLAFGPDGYLYFGYGDGGSSFDPACNAQRLDTLLGKMIRIDVDGGLPYAIPPDNPFVGVAGAVTLSEDGFVTAASIALTAVGPTCFVAGDAGRALVGRRPESATVAHASAATADAARPITANRASANYRSHMVAVMTARAIGVAAARASCRAVAVPASQHWRDLGNEAEEAG